MKYLALVVIGLISLSNAVIAQPIMTSADIPSVGQIYNYRFINQNGVNVGSTDVNQLWDYSNLVDSNSIRIDSMLSVASDPNTSLFPGTNLLIRSIIISNNVVTRNQYDYLKKEANSLKSVGYINSGVTYFFRDPVSQLMLYPFTYGNFFTDSSFLVIQYPNVIDSVKYIDSTYAVGYGTLKLPGNRIYTNVLQLRTEVTIRTSFGIAKSVNLTYWTPGITDALFTMDITNGIPTQIRYLTNYTSLPLTWLDFSGIVANRKIQLSWRTVYEKNTQYFIVERSGDGKHFKFIKRLLSVENSVHETIYRYLDENPEFGENYYRIKAIDMDGSVNCSKTILLNVSKPDFDVHIYPTITNKNLFIELNSINSEKISLQILDGTGRIIQKKSYQIQTGRSILSLNTSEFLKGTYRIVFDKSNLNTVLFIKE